MVPFYLFFFTLYNSFCQSNQPCWPRGYLNKKPPGRGRPRCRCRGRAARLLPQHRFAQQLRTAPRGPPGARCLPRCGHAEPCTAVGPLGKPSGCRSPRLPAASGWGKALGCEQNAACEEGLLQNPPRAPSKQPNPARTTRHSHRETRGNKTPFSSITLNDLICLRRRGFRRMQANSFACL